MGTQYGERLRQWHPCPQVRTGHETMTPVDPCGSARIWQVVLEVGLAALQEQVRKTSWWAVVLTAG